MYLKKELDQLEKKGLYNTADILEGENGACIIVDGRKMINLASNSYLGFVNREELKKAYIEATETYGVGAGAVRTINGSPKIHRRLEEKIVEFKGTETAIAFQSGFNCNMGATSTVMIKKDAILSNELNHASVIDGCRLSGAKIIRIKHQDMKDLKKKTKEAIESEKYKKIMYITNGVFSMDGDIARLPEVIPIVEEYGLITYADDAHGSGVTGKDAGTVRHSGLSDKIDMQMGTLSKAIGVVGGYVAGSKTLVDWSRARSQPFLFSTSLTPGAAAAALASITLAREHPELVEKIWEDANYFKEELKKVGYNIGMSETPTTPIILGDEKVTQIFSKKPTEHGIYAEPIVYPAVPLGTGRIRSIPIAEHTREILDRAVTVYQKVGKEMEVI